MKLTCPVILSSPFAVPPFREASSLLRPGPPLTADSVFALRVNAWAFSLNVIAVKFPCSFGAPVSGSCHLYAGCRMVSIRLQLPYFSRIVTVSSVLTASYIVTTFSYSDSLSLSSLILTWRITFAFSSLVQHHNLSNCSTSDRFVSSACHRQRRVFLHHSKSLLHFSCVFSRHNVTLNTRDSALI